MAKDWLVVVAPNLGIWNIPTTALQELERLITIAETALSVAKTEISRTPVATAQCREAFDALTAEMRDFKRRYFLTPPLSNPDYVSLGLRPPSGSHTPTNPPTAQVVLESYLVGRHELGVKVIYVTGNPNDPANKGYRIWYSVVGAGETQPANPDDLRKSFYTKRKKDIIEFDFDDSGKTVYFAVQIENDGKKGPWGPLVNALIP
jgi:hypothetical protein